MRGISARARWLTIGACAVASLGLYLAGPVLPTLYSAEPSYAGEVFSWVELLKQKHLLYLQDVGGQAGHVAASIRFIWIVAVVWLCYLVALLVARDANDSRWAMFVGLAGGLFLVVQFFSPVTLSMDVFGYAYHGRLVGKYGSNPYSPAAFVAHSDPFLMLLYGKQETTMYGPLALAVSTGVAWVSGEQVGLTVFGFRLVAAAAAAGTALFIWLIVRQLQPTRSTQALVLFLWNPLVVMEAGLSAHNDFVMTFLIAAAIYLYVRHRRIAGFLVLTLSVLVKFVSIVLLPLYLLMLYRDQLRPSRRRELLASILGGGLLLSVALLATSYRGGTTPRAANDGSLFKSAAKVVFGAQYINNIHSLLISEWRRIAVGETGEALQVPLAFRGSWVLAADPTVLRQAPGEDSAAVLALPPGAVLLTLNWPRDGWVWSHDCTTGQRGYLPVRELESIVPAPALAADPNLQRIAGGPLGNARVKWANAGLRLTTWIAFIGFWCVAATRVRDWRTFALSSCAVFLALYWLVGSWIWPWYIVWSLLLAALIFDSYPARLALLLSFTVLTLYPTISAPGSTGWVAQLSTYRSLIAFTLPLVVAVLYVSGQQIRRRCHDRSSIVRV
ncbi:MAG: hypothetical protein PCFJNLEI_03781 [Verrucomicrobiae bacterium]|nr:hypothetical protein [Verrucomicrobiae bacterium]